ncbi:hypothetical protein CAP39_07680 [Sphingomonas sp. IBVSS1]|nr:hypothetical protein CAP39_07680 [Sphingomonas sp. IBVSS1]
MLWQRSDPSMAIQLVGMLSVVGMEALAQSQLPVATPLPVRAAAWGIALAVVAAWVLITPRFRAHIRAGRLPAADRLTHMILAACAVGGIGQIWLLFPWAGALMQLVIVIFFTAATPILALATVERPPQRGHVWLIPVLPPVGIVLWYLFHPDALGVAVAVIVAVFTAVTMQLRRGVQAQVNRTHAAMLTAQQARADLLAERVAKARFIASAWHDLGQPIQAARLFSDQASRSPDAARRASAAAHAEQAFATVERQLGAMLDHLRLDSGDVQLAISALPAGPLLASAAALHVAAAREQGVALQVRPGTALVQADADLAGRALANLIHNGLRHAGARQIRLTARRCAAQAQLWVIDDGRGIAPADRAGLFEDFVQGHDTGRGGFGLGLSGARRMARLMGGDLRFHPRRRGGAAFCLELPAA